MYLVCTDDPTPRRLATSTTLIGALHQADLLAQQVRRQLGRNGEGHVDFWLRLVVVDPDGRVVAWWASNGGSAHPSRRKPERTLCR